MTGLDWYYMGLIAFGLIVDHFVIWPGFIRRYQRDPSSARLWWWTVGISLLWILTLAGLALWVSHDRTWVTLGFTVPQGWPLWGSVILVAGFVLLQAQGVVALIRDPSQKPILRTKLEKLKPILPHSVPELPLFFVVSLTAGFCEEFIFRGYLIWAFAPLLGWWGAAAVSTAIFAAVHAYQGRAGVMQAGILGAVFALLVALCDSLLPAIVMHALIDACGGVIAWLVFREEPINAEVTRPGKSA
jgi:uncharacterized protein